MGFPCVSFTYLNIQINIFSNLTLVQVVLDSLYFPKFCDIYQRLISQKLIWVNRLLNPDIVVISVYCGAVDVSELLYNDYEL